MVMADPARGDAIEVRNAAFSYDGSAFVFRNVGLEVGKGSICCLMGVNGCGKSTLIDCVLGMNDCAEGQVSIGGVAVKGMKPKDLARFVSFVPQVHDRSFPYKVADIVLMGRTAYQGGLGIPDEEDRLMCERALRHCRIEHLATRPYTQISGGEMQMVMLARALVQDTPFMVMDEPTAHLDFKNELIFEETVVELVKERNIGVILATHSPNQAFYFENAGVKTQVALMDAGSIRRFGAPRDVLTEQTLGELYAMDVRIAEIDLGDGSVCRQIVPVRTHGAHKGVRS